jgi:hypothetical protein
LTFVLPNAARVVFVVKQVAPVCATTGRFAVNGRPGLNRIRFPGRTSRLRLDPGTYLITARTAGGRVVQRVIVVVVKSGAPTDEQLAAARASNLCSTAASLASASGSTGASNPSTFSSSQQPVERSLIPPSRSASGPGAGPTSRSGGVLGTTSVERAARAIRPVLIGLLALAIALLGIASLPRTAGADSRANELLARHRAEIAGLGTAAFLAVVVAFLLG